MKNQLKDVIKCKCGTYDIANHIGECPESCEFGAWHNGMNGNHICGSECLECGGTLYLSQDDKIVCDECE